MEATSQHSTITGIQQERLILAYHSTRLSQNLSHNDARHSSNFWTQIRDQMSRQGCQKEAGFWQYNWQQMYTKLMVRIERARRRKCTDTSWLTLLNSQLMAVLLDSLDEARLAYVERCMAEDVLDPDDRLSLCATVFWDLASNDRLVIRCQHCRQTFDDADQLLVHVRRYYDVPATRSDDLLVLETTTTTDDVVDLESSCHHASADNTLPVEQQAKTMVSETTEPARASEDVAFPADFGFMTDNESSADESHMSDEPVAKSICDEGMSNERLEEIEDNIRSLLIARKKCNAEGCSLSFRTYRGLNQHTMAMHNRKAYQCSLCPRSLETERTFKMHLIEHERPAQCDICKRNFPNKTSIIVHDRTAAFPCRDCDKMFRTTNIRGNHWMLVHGSGLSKLEHMCEHCGKSFRYKVNLTKHLRTHSHSDELPKYKCDLCGHQFSSQSYVARHIQRVHTRDRPFKCRHDGCLEMYRYHDTRLRHEIRVHGKSGYVIKPPEYRL